MPVEEGAVDGAASGEEPARAGLRTAGDEDFRLGYGVVADLQRLGHVLRDGAREHHAVGMARRGGEADAVAAEVEIDVARGVELHLDRGVASGRDLAQLERAAEELPDLGAHLCRVEGHAPVAGTQDEPLARGRADAVVVREADAARCAPGTFAAEETAAQVEREGLRRDRARRADRCSLLHIPAFPVRRGFVQFGTSAEGRGQLHGVEVRDILLPVAA